MIDSMPWLSVCIFMPLVGGLVTLMVGDERWGKRIGLGFAVLTLCVSLAILHRFDVDHAGFQLREDMLWIPGLNVHYQLGIDGISVLFLPMTALLTLMTILAGWRGIRDMSRFHLAQLLILESATLGVYAALDTVLFFLFWEMTVPPLFFLIGLWGVGAERRHAAMKYTLYMLFGGVPLLFGFVIAALNHTSIGSTAAALSFSLPELLQSPLPDTLQTPVFCLLMLGFAVKAPLPPFHTWLPTTAMEAPPQITAWLVGLKLGLYGIVRFAIPLAPTATLEHRNVIAIVGAVTLIYGALIAIRQSNLRRMLAYASISHVGLVVLALLSLDERGVQGALMQMVNFTVIASSLMLLTGMLHRRLDSTEHLHLGGLAKPLPRLTTLFFLFALAGIGVPGGNGFPAELLMLLGVLHSSPALALAVMFAAVLAAGYMLDLMRKAFWGPVLPANKELDDLTRREWLLLCAPVLLVLLWGFYPQSLIQIQSTSIRHWLKQLQQPALLTTEFRQPANITEFAERL